MSMPAICRSFLSDVEIDALIREDVPYFDLTSWALDIDMQPGRIEFMARDPGVLCGTEEVRRLLEKLGVHTTFSLASGTFMQPAQSLLRAEGPAGALHMGWKVSLNILEYGSGIATRTRRLVELASSANPSCTVVSTRKGFPGTRNLATKAVLAGGASPHRLGLSETILVFEQHRAFLGDTQAIKNKLRAARQKAPEKKILVEVDSPAQAVELLDAGIDGVQFDKLSPPEIASSVQTLRALNPRLTIIAAGGVNESNAAAYAATGVDALATSSIFFGKPTDIKACIQEA